MKPVEMATILHTQEVTGSSPVAPTNTIIRLECPSSLQPDLWVMKASIDCNL
jgi:hypothetical protein